MRTDSICSLNLSLLYNSIPKSLSHLLVEIALFPIVILVESSPDKGDTYHTCQLSFHTIVVK